MTNEEKIQAINEMIADANEVMADPALAGIYKSQIKGHIAEAEKQIAKLQTKASA